MAALVLGVLLMPRSPLLKHLCLPCPGICLQVLGLVAPEHSKLPGCLTFFWGGSNGFLLYCVNLHLLWVCPGKCVSRQKLSGAPGSLEASWLPLPHWIYAACLCALQALKRKPDLFLCSNLDVKAVFQCGEYHRHSVETPACSCCGARCRPARS